MRFNPAWRRAATFWLASGGIFFFMDMQILGESAFAEPTIVEPSVEVESPPAADAPSDVGLIRPVTD